MIPIGDLEIHPNASKPDVPTDAPMEEKSKGLSTEDQSMSPLHLEPEEV